MQQYKNTVTAATGLPIEGATVTVTLAAGGAASLYAGNNSGALGSNVLTTGADGGYVFYAANGRYTLTIAASGFAGSTLDVVLYDPDDIVDGADLTGATSSQVALQAYINARAGQDCPLPAGTFLLTDALSIPANTTVRGAGSGTILKALTLVNGGSGAGHRVLDVRNVTGVKVRDLQFDCASLTGLATGMRCILFSGASQYEVTGCRFVTPGAAVASVNCHHYEIAHNQIEVQALSGAAAHDGIIDQWWGCHDFQVHHNEINGTGIGLYPLLVTGTQTDGSTAAACYSFSITDNQVKSCIKAGVWVMGRSGGCYDFTVHGNRVAGVEDVTNLAGYGVALTDCYDFSCTGNVTRDTWLSGVRVFNESATYGSTAGRSGMIACNTVVDANAAGSTNADVGSAISVTDASQRLTVGPNAVIGSAHRYAVHLGTNTTDVELIGGNLQPGVAGTVLNQATDPADNLVPGGALYTPTLTSVANVTTAANGSMRYERRGATVYGSGRVEITPTATGNTDTQVGLSIPFPSNFTATADATGSASTSFGTSASIFADTTNDRITLRFPAEDAGANVFYFTFAYTIK